MVGQTALRIEIIWFQGLQQKMMLDSSECCDQTLTKELNVYKKVKLLGTGSFGKAYLVKSENDGTLWVIKQVNIADLPELERENSMKQAKIHELVSHQNIINFREVYCTRKMKLNIVMEYADGTDLASKIKQAKDAGKHFEQNEILNWFTQMCLGVKHIHDRKIIHRDLKGQNIFMTAGNIVKIGDFGVAKLLENTMSKARTIVGSPYYLSPEIIQNKPYSFSTDIWSLGTLLFEMCSLVPPFTANNIQFLALKIVKGAYNQIPNKYSPELKALIKSMLHTKESQRPTINQILCSKIISSRIQLFVSEEEAKGMIQNKRQQGRKSRSMQQFFHLPPPPNLLMEESQCYPYHRSDVFSYQDVETASPSKIKARTPQVGGKKENQVHPSSAAYRRNSEHGMNEFKDLMHIKPSHIEMAPKHERPRVMAPKPSQARPPAHPNSVTKVESIKKIAPPSAFSKKKPSMDIRHAVPREFFKPRIMSKELTSENSELKIKQIFQSKKTVQAEKKPKKLSVKKTMRPKKSVVPEERLEVCSEQAKRLFQAQKPERATRAKKKKQASKKCTEATPTTPNFHRETVMEEEKTTSDHDIRDSHYESNYYDNEVFDQYKESASDGSKDLELSDSTENKFNAMLNEMKNIKQYVSDNKGKSKDLPMFGGSIPQILEFSVDIRDDYLDTERLSEEKLSEETQSDPEELQLSCFANHSELEAIRMRLEDVFGMESIIRLHQIIERDIRKFGLEFNEQELMENILREMPELEEKKLRRHFGTIVTVVTLQNQF